MLKRADVIIKGPELTGDTNSNLIIFYTSLYRSLTFPRRLDELNENNEIVHYSPYDPSGGTHKGPLCTDNGMWDTFRTVYPLLSLLYPDYLGLCFYNLFLNFELKFLDCLIVKFFLSQLNCNFLIIRFNTFFYSFICFLFT